MTEHVSVGVSAYTSRGIIDFESITSLASWLEDNLGEHYDLTVVTRSAEDTRRFAEMYEGLPKREVSPINVIHSSRHIKKWAEPTLFVETAIGDKLAYSHSAEALLDSFSSRQPTLTGLDSLIWVVPDPHSRRGQYSRFVNSYGLDNIGLDPRAVGFIATRGAVNAALSSEHEVYDFFVALGLSNSTFGRAFAEDCDRPKWIYTTLEMNRLITKHVSPYRPSMLTMPLAVLGCIALVFWIGAIGEIESGHGFVSALVALASLALMSVSYDIVDLQRQVLASVSGKSVVGYVEKTTVS